MIKNLQPLQLRGGNFAFDARSEYIQPRAFGRSSRKAIHAGRGIGRHAVDVLEDLAVETVVHEVSRVEEVGLKRRLTRIVVNHVQHVFHNLPFEVAGVA